MGAPYDHSESRSDLNGISLSGRLDTSYTLRHGLRIPYTQDVTPGRPGAREVSLWLRPASVTVTPALRVLRSSPVCVTRIESRGTNGRTNRSAPGGRSMARASCCRSSSTNVRWGTSMAPTYRGLSGPALKRAHGFTSLLTPDGYNPKTKKGRARGYSSAILHLAPASLSGRNVCQWSSAGCRAACLNTAGHGGIVRRGETTNAIQLARIARTEWLFTDRAAFMAQLFAEIETHIRRAVRNGLIPVVRLNGTSDLPWERITGPNGVSAFVAFPTIRFYDYTKSSERVLMFVAGRLPYNYHLTFSRSEENGLDTVAVLAAGGNVAAVFQKALPSHWNGVRVVNGDQDDLRFLDPAGVVVGLKAKGKARRDASGFVVLADVPTPQMPGRRAPILLPMASPAPFGWGTITA